MTSGWAKIFADNPRLGFLAHAQSLELQIAAGNMTPGAASVADLQRMVFNDRLDAGVAAFFMLAAIVILLSSALEWYAVISGKRKAVSTEVPFTPVAPITASLHGAQ
jgi:carbon starvation protein